MRIVCISDTHGRHFRKLDLPKGDVLVVAGDLCMNGNLDELREAADYIKAAALRSGIDLILAIGGNHDFAFQEHPLEARRLLADRGIIYLQDTEVNIRGFKFYGSPWSPTFMRWAFMKDRGPEMRRMWDLIPGDTNILITHTPPQYILDKTVVWGDMAGCEELRDVVLNHLPNLQVHIFGHIHEGYGQWMDMSGRLRPIHFVNASRVNAAYSPVNEPVVVEIDKPRRTD